MSFLNSITLMTADVLPVVAGIPPILSVTTSQNVTSIDTRGLQRDAKKKLSVTFVFYPSHVTLVNLCYCLGDYLIKSLNYNRISKYIINLFVANLGRVLALSEQLEGGKTKPESKHKGFNKPLLTVVFFCHSKIQAVVNRLHSVMAGLLGNSKELPFFVRFFVDPFNPATYARQKHSGGLHPQHKGQPEMKAQSTGAITPQNPQNQLEEFKDAAISLCGGNAFLFLPNPSQATLSIIIAKCERLLAASKAIQALEVSHV